MTEPTPDKVLTEEQAQRVLHLYLDRLWIKTHPKPLAMSSIGGMLYKATEVEEWFKAHVKEA